MKSGFVIALLALVLPEASARAADPFAMGLDKLTWGMSREQAEAAYPALGPWLPPYAHPLVDPQTTSILEIANYSYAGCSFAVRLQFDQNRLYSVWIDHEGDFTPCASPLEHEFVNQYGPPDEARLSVEMDWIHPYGSQYFFGYEDGDMHWITSRSAIDFVECHHCQIGNTRMGAPYAPDLAIEYRLRDGTFVDKERY